MPIRQVDGDASSFGTMVAINSLSVQQTMTEMSELKEDIERNLHKIGRELHNLVDRFASLRDRDTDFTPDTDVIDRSDAIHIVMDVPGVEKKDLYITLKDQVLLVRGERRRDTSQASTPDSTQTLKERRTGFFSRSVPVANVTDGASVKATLTNGVLHITCSRDAQTSGKGTEIPVE